MAFVLNNGQGTLHRNKLKEEGTKQPDMRGDLMLNGVMHEVAGWTKTGSNGKWLSLSVKVKETPTSGEQQGTVAVSADIDCPF